MLKPLKITFLFESTTLWGGNKVALEQAEALYDAGYRITMLSKDSGPSWYHIKLPVMSVPKFDASTIPESDIIVGTYWPTVKAAVESRRGTTVHLCQGYEGDCKEMQPLKAAIDKVYSYRIPKLTVSPHLDAFLRKRFRAKTYYIGQMLNRDVFYPSRNEREDADGRLFRILVTGPFEVDSKNVAFTLRGVVLAKKKLGCIVKLIRVSQFPLSREEKAIMKPAVYHFHMPHFSMGEIYRASDLFISMSKEAEGFGLPALEAMGCGVPTILSRISSYTSFDETPDYALFVHSSEPKALAKAIVRLLHDSPLRDRLIQRGLTVAENFTREKVVNRLVNAFQEIRNK